MTEPFPSTALHGVAFFTHPPANYEIMNSGLAGGMLLPRPQSRGKPLLPAQPLSLHVQDCLEFLARIEGIHVIGGSKKEFQLRVDVRARNDASRMVSFEIPRTSEQVHALQHDILEACRQHPCSSVTGLDPCALCEPLKILPPLPESTERLFSSKATIHKTVEDRLNLFIAGGLVAPTNPEYHCEGLVTIPVLLRNFLLRGVDETTALK